MPNNSVSPMPQRNGATSRASMTSGTRNSAFLSVTYDATEDGGSVRGMPGSLVGVTENLFLHPEAHNPVSTSPNHINHKTNGNGNGAMYNGNMAMPAFGHVTIDVTTDGLVSEGVAAQRMCFIFAPIVFLMTCLGLYHPSGEDVEPEREGCWGGNWCGRMILISWNFLVLIYLVFNVAAVGYYVNITHDVNSLPMVTEVLIVVRFATAIIIVLCFFTIFESSSRYEAILEAWCVWLRWQPHRGTGYLRKRVCAVTSAAFLLGALPSVLSGLSVFGYIPGMGLEHSSFITTPTKDGLTDWALVLRIVFTITISMTNMILAIFIAFFSSICHLLAYELRILSREIQVEVRGQAVIWDMKIEEISGQEVTVLEYLRRKHGKIVAVAIAVDAGFRELLFLVYLLDVPLVIFQLYILLGTQIYHQECYPCGGGTIILITVWTIGEMFIIWASAIKIHHWAHEPVKMLQSIDIHERKEITHAHQTSFHLFMTTLTTAKISITLWGLISLTKDFFLMVILFVTTYLLLLRDTSGNSMVFHPVDALNKMVYYQETTHAATSPLPSMTLLPANPYSASTDHERYFNLTNVTTRTSIEDDFTLMSNINVSYYFASLTQNLTNNSTFL